MKKTTALFRIVAFALVVCLCAAFAPVMIFATATPSVYDGGAASTALRVDENDSNVLYIDNAADLKLFADTLKSTNNSYSGKTIKLTCDIVWNNGNAADWATVAPANVWDANGGFSRAFAGTFDGQGHTISGLYSDTTATNGKGGGFIAHTWTDAVVKNVAIVNSYFAGTGRIGGVVGNFQQGNDASLTVQNVYSDAILVATNSAAGIVGEVRNAANQNVIIENAVFAGTINAPKAAGILGNFRTDGEIKSLSITNSLFAGTFVNVTDDAGIYYGPKKSTVSSHTVSGNIVLGNVVSGKAVSDEYYPSTGNLYVNTLTASAGNTAMALADIQNISDDALQTLGFTGWASAEYNGQKMPLPATVATLIGATLAQPPAPTPANVTVNASVTLNGQAQAGKTVALYFGGNKVEEKVSDAEGKVSFAINNLVAGTYVYTLKQLNVTDGEGYVYDVAEKTITITVNDQGQANVAGDNAVFANTFTPAAPIKADATVSASVTVNGDADAGKTVGLFQGSTMIVSQPTDADGKVSFLLEDLPVGAHNYSMKLLNVENANGYVFDLVEKPVVVTVSPEGNVAVDVEEIIFANTYKAPPVGSYWDGTSVSTSLEKDSDGAYLIQSAADLAYFQKLVQEIASTSKGLSGNVYKLTTNIIWNSGDASDWATTAPANKWSTLSTAIDADYNARFAGTIDGQGHVIYGLYIKNEDAAGLISYGGEGLCIKNLSIQNSYISGTKRASAFLGAARNGKATIKNCYTDAIIDCSGAGAAGFVGSVNNYAGVEVIVEDCVFDGTVSSKNYTAGIVGESGGVNPKISITNCVNLGKVNGTGDYVGGIFAGKDGAALTLKNCINRGEVTAPAGKSVGALFAAYQGGEFSCTDNIFDNSMEAYKTLPDGAEFSDTNLGKTAIEIASLTPATLPISFTGTDWAMGKLDGDDYMLPRYVALKFAIANPGGNAGGGDSSDSSDTGSSSTTDSSNAGSTSKPLDPNNPNPPTSDVATISLFVFVVAILSCGALVFVFYRRKDHTEA